MCFKNRIFGIITSFWWLNKLKMFVPEAQHEMKIVNMNEW